MKHHETMCTDCLQMACFDFGREAYILTLQPPGPKDPQPKKLEDRCLENISGAMVIDKIRLSS